ncbi:MAG: ATPase, T2SS/T4P/T4SS family, partial [Bilophila sp.]
MESMAAENPEKAYITSEDPPEFPLSGVEQVLVSTNADRSSVDEKKRGLAYTNAIAGAMRSDPDVLMIGEIRYPEAATAAIDAALTGHGVFVTLHANNAFGIIPRMESLLNAAGYVSPLDHLC